MVQMNSRILQESLFQCPNRSLEPLVLCLLLHTGTTGYNGIYFIQSRRNLYGIQNYLNSVISNVAFLQTHSVGSGIVTADLPSISIRMALAVIAIIPVLVAYPFFQKSFVAGITVGSVKG